MNFVFSYRKIGYTTEKVGFFKKEIKKEYPWQSVKVKGFTYDKELDRCFLFLSGDEGRIEIPQWSNYEVKLGSDWVAAEKNAASQAQAIEQ